MVNLRLSYFWTKVCVLEKFEAVDLTVQYFFRAPVPKYPNKTILVLHLKKFLLQEILHFDKLKVQKLQKSNMTTVLAISSLKISNKVFSVQKFFLLCMKLCMNLNLQA